MMGTEHRIFWILGSGVLMGALSLVGGLAALGQPAAFRRLLSIMVAFAAGSLIGGALFHLIPESLEASSPLRVFGLTAIGFAAFFALEQFLHYHHCHNPSADCEKPLVYLILVGDGLHNFLDGMAIAASFLADVRLGVTAWLAAVAHEIPQELGDFGALVYGGWTVRKALLFNFLTALTFLLGGVLVYALSLRFDVEALVPVAAGNFLYIGASDLLPESHHRHPTIWTTALTALGIALMYVAVSLARF